MSLPGDARAASGTGRGACVVVPEGGGGEGSVGVAVMLRGGEGGPEPGSKWSAGVDRNGGACGGG